MDYSCSFVVNAVKFVVDSIVESALLLSVCWQVSKSISKVQTSKQSRSCHQ